jgi:hypothetical protein
MEEIITKEIAEKLMKIKGEVRGMAMKGDLEFILQERGEEGLKELEDAIANLGYSVKYKELKALSFYPIGLKGIMLLTIKKLFNFSDEKFQEMGAFGSKINSVIRIFMKYLFSPKIFVSQSQRMWRYYYTIGNCKAELNEKEKYVLLRVYNFPYFPDQCKVLKGYFGSILKMVIKHNVTCEETKCTFRGDDYHEFLLKW